MFLDEERNMLPPISLLLSFLPQNLKCLTRKLEGFHKKQVNCVAGVTFPETCTIGDYERSDL